MAAISAGGLFCAVLLSRANQIKEKREKQYIYFNFLILFNFFYALFLFAGALLVVQFFGVVFFFCSVFFDSFLPILFQGDSFSIRVKIRLYIENIDSFKLYFVQKFGFFCVFFAFYTFFSCLLYSFML